MGEVKIAPRLVVQCLFHSPREVGWPLVCTAFKLPRVFFLVTARTIWMTVSEAYTQDCLWLLLFAPNKVVSIVAAEVRRRFAEQTR